MPFREMTGKIYGRSGYFPEGIALLRDRDLNKGTAFTEEERDAFGLRGLLPPRVHTMEEQVMRVLENFHDKSSDLERYIHMMALQERNKTLFYRVVVDNIQKMMPIIYTPTVGQACLRYAHIYQRSRGLFISAADKGRILSILRNWPYDNVRLIVVTDGERILGLGDLGANGMGIPVGKIALYTVCAGLHPSLSLPVTFDVGTDNEEILKDPLYIGLRQRRLRGKAYSELIEEFVAAVQTRYPKALIQLEDFGNSNAFHLLAKYRNEICLFDDDIQGTGSVVLAGLYSALRITGGRMGDQRIVMLGAGQAAIGTATMIAKAMVSEGLTEKEARSRFWLVDSKGLVVVSRADLNEQKRVYAQVSPSLPDLRSVVEMARPTVIIGASGQYGVFNKGILQAMAEINQRPVVFSLSNPTANTECTAEEAYKWTRGRAIFASGSPFGPVNFEGRTYFPGQGNNAYIFPGVGLGVNACEAQHVTDEMFFEAARTLADQVTEAEIEQGHIYPPLTSIRQVSAAIATTVAEVAYRQGLASLPRPDDLAAYVRSQIYEPVYQSYL